MGPVDLLSKMRSGVLGLEDHAVNPQAFVALIKLFAVPAVSLALARIGQITTSYLRPCVYYIFIPQTTESYPITKKRGMIR